MNITLAIDDRVVEKAREVARRQGTSLQELIRRYLSGLTGESDREQVLEHLRQLEAAAIAYQHVNPRPPYQFNRDEVYEERLSRHEQER